MTEHFADGALTLDPAPIATLTLAVPERRNAMSRAMWAALPGIAARIAEDEAIRVLIVTGAGGSFSAGADIGEFAEVYASSGTAAEYNATIRAGLAALRDLPRPVLARIEGPCVGGGVALALACDLRFAAEGAVFAIPPSRLGIAYSPGDTALLVEAVGAAAAKDLLFSARRVSAAEALALRLIDRLAPTEGLHGAVEDYARSLARLSPASIRQAKATVNALAPVAEDPRLAAAFAALFEGPEFAEGRAAFLERRDPRF